MDLPDYLVDSLHRAAIAIEQSHDFSEEKARVAWRQYACAALPAMIADASKENYGDALIVEGAAHYATLMVEAERAHFDKAE